GGSRRGCSRAVLLFGDGSSGFWVKRNAHTRLFVFRRDLASPRGGGRLIHLATKSALATAGPCRFCVAHLRWTVSIGQLASITRSHCLTMIGDPRWTASCSVNSRAITFSDAASEGVLTSDT